MPIIHTPFISLAQPHRTLSNFCYKILIQTVRIPKLLHRAKILLKSSTL